MPNRIIKIVIGRPLLSMLTVVAVLFSIGLFSFRYLTETDLSSVAGSSALVVQPETLSPTPQIVLEEKNDAPFLPIASPPPPPPPPDMDRMKKQGCVADGLLSDYGGNYKRMADLINRSECYYLHRALETWLAAPDFKKAEKIKNRIEKEEIVYGMFIAEAISKKSKMFSLEENRYFNFSQMCREGTDNFWGEHTCKPSFEKEEYRKYVLHIAKRAMDIGIQSFMFGQIFYQEKDDLSEAIAPQIVAEMKSYASSRGMEIVVGAQTNDIADREYLRTFDYIEGGVGINMAGNIESGACHSRWWKKPGDWCWALLWHDRYASEARNVFLHLDWSGKIGDDMSVFSRMHQPVREQTLERLHAYFTGRDMGFMMPMLAPLHRDNGGCYGVGKRFYTPDRKYKCKDEDAINAILK